jgi:type I restriction enzyme S subunit
VPFIGITDVVDGRVDWTSVSKWVSEETHAELTRGRLPVPGDILYTTVGATFGAAFPVEDDRKFIFQRHIAHITPSRLLPWRFVLHQLNSPHCFTQARQGARGAAQPTVNLEVLRRFFVALAPVSEQLFISHLVAAAIENTKGLCDRVAESWSTLAGLNQSILAKAFRGELVPQDPNDEPASKLLERIRHEREGAMPKARGRTTRADRKAAE